MDQRGQQPLRLKTPKPHLAHRIATIVKFANYEADFDAHDLQNMCIESDLTDHVLVHHDLQAASTK